MGITGMVMPRGIFMVDFFRFPIVVTMDMGTTTDTTITATMGLATAITGMATMGTTATGIITKCGMGGTVRRRWLALVTAAFSCASCALMEDFPPEEPLSPAEAQRQAEKREIQQRAQASRSSYEAMVGGHAFQTWP